MPLGQRDHRTSRVERLGDILNERLWRTCNKRKLHVFPVFAACVIDDCPALQQGLFSSLVWKNNSICAFPDRHFADVANKHVAIARTRSSAMRRTSRAR